MSDKEDTEEEAWRNKSERNGVHGQRRDQSEAEV